MWCFGFGGRLNDIARRHRKRSGSLHVLPAFTLKPTQSFCSQAVFVCVIPVVVKANIGYSPVRRYAVVCDGHWVRGEGGGVLFGRTVFLIIRAIHDSYILLLSDPIRCNRRTHAHTQ